METEFDTDVMIAYPYVFPQDTDLPIDYDIDAHSTILYLGEMEDIPATKDEVLAALAGIQLEDTGIVDVEGLTLFGEDKEVLVMLLNSGNLHENFDRIETALKSVGVTNASEFDYNPHITLDYNYHGPTVGYTLPTTVGLGRPRLWWGVDTYDIV